MGFAMISPAAFANETRLSLPHNAEAAVALTLSEKLTDEPSNMLQVFVGTEEQCCDTKTPMAGRYTHKNNVLSFTPAFGFSAGQHYVARVRSEEKEELIPFRIHSDIPMPPAKITKLYPSGETLPENTLRFYIHFSKPMKPHVALNYIKLRDTSGNVDDAAFMQFKQELWNEDRTRLTVLMDPGRIKRNVATNRALGPALIAGQRYEFVVEPGWPTADGTSVLPEFSKSFLVSEPLREMPSVDLWEVITPQLGTRDPLRIEFDRPYDHQLLRKEILVGQESDRKIEGDVEIGEDESSWYFTPKTAWADEQVWLVVNSILEDVAGNNFKDLLDHTAGSRGKTASHIAVPVVLESGVKSWAR